MTEPNMTIKTDLIISLIETLKLDQEKGSVKINQLQEEISILRQETNSVREILELIIEKTGESHLDK